MFVILQLAFFASALGSAGTNANEDTLSREEANDTGSRLMRAEMRSQGSMAIHGHDKPAFEDRNNDDLPFTKKHAAVKSNQGTDCDWADWSEWTACAATCGNGSSTRFRRLRITALVLQSRCTGDADESRSCGSSNCPVDCNWQDWQGWSECSTTCGTGVKYNRRSILPAQFGGNDCSGAFEKSMDCEHAACDAENTWSLWSDWTGCSKTCGGGEEARHRQALKAEPARDGSSLNGGCEQTRTCAKNECPVDCILGDWADWGTCSASCGDAESRRVRPVQQQVAYGGSACDNRIETNACLMPACSTCAWDTWADWSTCSVSCGAGSQVRSRSQVGTNPEDDCCKEEKEEQTCTSSSESCFSDCHIADWSSWSKCSTSCSAGIRERSREIQPPQNGGAPCPQDEASHEELSCNLGPCPTECVWDEWADWSSCSSSCGDGKSNRSRCIAKEATAGGAQCSEIESEETRSCNEANCPVACVWGKWSEWFPCTASCGPGHKSRTRVVKTHELFGGLPCQDLAESSTVCTVMDCAEDCQWLDWSDWAQCSSSCGNSTRSRSRSFIPALYGGKTCSGSPKEAKLCEGLPDCPKDCAWDSWSDWQPCTATCGVGFERKVRLRKNYESSGGKICQGTEEDERTCNQNPCPVDCQNGDWNSWGSCSLTCGTGTRTRYRDILREAQLGGRACGGGVENASIGVTSCHLGECASDCVWALWNEWTICTKSCGGGFTTRTRNEITPSAHGGRLCEGSTREETVCNAHPCPRACIWDDWGKWSSCTVSCAGGERNRSRNVFQPVQFGGEQCPGEASQKEPCNVGPCPIDCQWSTWTDWSVCTATCDGGDTLRQRHQVRAPEHDGLACLGGGFEQKSCNTVGCPRDCKWGPWSQWSSCSVSCGGGSIKRYRDISIHKKNDGADCLGNFEQNADCNNDPCPSSCVWDEWTPWPCCPVTCGGGKKLSSRGKLKEAASGGTPCEGNATREEICNTQDCPFDCLLVDWGDWEPCTVSCGTGNQLRTRVQMRERFGGKPCDEPLTDFKECANEVNHPFCPSTTLLTTTIPTSTLTTTKTTMTSTSTLPSLTSTITRAPLASVASGPPSASATAPEPCAKGPGDLGVAEIKTALDAFGSVAAGNLSAAIDHLMKIKAKAKADAGVDGREVSEVTGSLDMYIGEADSFIASPEAKTSVQKALSHLTQVAERNVQVELTYEGTFTQPEWQKKLRGNVRAKFTLHIFENDNIGDAAALSARINAKELNADKVTLAVENGLEETGVSTKFGVAQATKLQVGKALRSLPTEVAMGSR